MSARPFVCVVLVVALLGLDGRSSAQDEEVRSECLAHYRKAEALWKQGKLKEAAEVYEKAVELAPPAFGADHRDTVNMQNNLAVLYQYLARSRDAEPLLLRSLKAREDTLPADDPLIAHSLNNLAELYRLMGRFEDARPLFRRSLKIKEKKDPDDPSVAVTLNNMALLEKSAGYYHRAPNPH